MRVAVLIILADDIFKGVNLQSTTIYNDQHRTVDLLWDYVNLVLTPRDTWPIGLDQPSDIADSQRYAVALEFPFESSQGCLHFLSAGQQDAEYGSRVRDFDWTAFYERLGGGECLDRFRERLRGQYDFVLIDSRTGVADTSSICTVQMPDIVVLCFTYNLQSIRGIAAVAESIAEQRPGITFVLAPMRVPLEEVEGLEEARSFAGNTLRQFLPSDMAESRQQEYWAKRETAYRGAYAFHEVLAVFRDPLEGRNTLLGDMEWLAGEILGEDIALRMAKLDESIRRKYVLEMPVPDRYYRDCVARWSDDRYALDKRFVRLTLLLDQGEDEQGPRSYRTSETFYDLREILARIPEQAVVLLGPPGSGKSTLLRHFELDNARAVLAGRTGGGLSPLTFFIQLNDYKPMPSDTLLPPPKDWLAQRWAAQYPDLPTLDTLLRQQRMTLLLDALNEIPYASAESIQRWKAFLRELARDYPGNWVIFSCRDLDYSTSLSSKELPVPQVRIEPLSDAQVQSFVHVYSPEYGAALWQNLQGSPQLKLLRSPYYLKLLIEQTVAGEIPTGRAALFTGFVRQALRREVERDNALLQPDELLHERDVQRLIQARWRTPFELPERGVLIPELAELAFAMQARQTTNEALQIRIAYDDALASIDHVRAEDILKAGGALGVLEQDLGRDEVLYVHQLVQEYFAARHLARQPQAELVQQEWRAHHIMPRLQSTLDELADADPLPPLPNTGWEETTVLAAAMAPNVDRFITDLKATNLSLAGRCAAQPEVTVSEALKEELRRALVQRTQEPMADLRARIAAGLALGELGHPLFSRCEGSRGSYLLPPLLAIPGGTYLIGSDEGLYEDEAPVHGVEIESFAIAQFPVTNAEWTLFMQAGGYEDERWWETEAAQAWRRGEGTAEGPKQSWRENRKFYRANLDTIHQWQQQGRIAAQEAEGYKEIARMSDDAFEALLREWYPEGRQTQPAFWTDNTLNHPAQPVVGICWFEARAYCAWLSAQTGQTFRLPTEAEWEAAARRSQHRRFAFGDEFDAAHCNTFETHIRRATPIGVFPGGATPEGLADMTGNTWAWTSSLYNPYPYDLTDGRENLLTKDARRVVRGGSWDAPWVYARTTFRYHYTPVNRSYDLGFRCLMRPSPSGS